MDKARIKAKSNSGDGGDNKAFLSNKIREFGSQAKLTRRFFLTDPIKSGINSVSARSFRPIFVSEISFSAFFKCRAWTKDNPVSEKPSSLGETTGCAKERPAQEIMRAESQSFKSRSPNGGIQSAQHIRDAGKFLSCFALPFSFFDFDLIEFFPFGKGDKSAPAFP